MASSSRTELFLKIIAWFALIGGSLAGVSGLISGLMFLFTPMGHVYQNMPRVDPVWAAAMDNFMRNQSIIGLIKTPFYLAAAAAGLGILKGHEWGRKTLAMLIWFFIAANLASAAYAATAVDMSGMFKALPNAKPGNTQFMQSAGIAMKVMAGVMTLFWCSLLGVSAWFLRRQETRDHFEAA